MSLLARRKLITHARLTPVLQTGASGSDTDASYDIVAGATPTPGRMMIVFAGGTQTRTVASTAGWINSFTYQSLNAGVTTLDMWYKKATVETATIGTINWSSALQGNWIYTEWDNLDDSPYFTHINANQPLTFTLAYPTYYVPYASAAVGLLALSAASNSWVLDNGFSNLAFAAVGQNSPFKAGYKIYGDLDPSETTTWTSVNSRDAAGALVILNGKLA